MNAGCALPGFAFLCYAREDAGRADWLQGVLEAGGITVWRDTDQLWPGEDWRARIRRAITQDAMVFVACVSRQGLGRAKGRHHEELLLAIEQLRLRRPGDPWIIPVRFDDCQIPDYDLGGGRTLGSLTSADLFGQQAGAGAGRLVTAITRIMGREAGDRAAPGTGPVLATPAAAHESVPPAVPGVDLGLILPMGEEFDCAREILAFGPAIRRDGHYLYPFSVAGGTRHGVAVVLFGMGLTSSAAAAAHLLATSGTRMLALVGIAGALDRGLRLGDVVIASSVDEYLHAAKATPGPDGAGYEFQAGGLSWQASHDIVEYARHFRYLDAPDGWFRAWQDRARQRRDPGLQAGVPGLAGDYPDYKVAPIATGDVVGAAAPFATWLRSKNRLRAALEMEAGGVAHAVYRDGRADLLVVRGISDFADERKTALDTAISRTGDPGAWRRYAALNAADLFATLVTHPQFPWRQATLPAEREHRASGP